MSENITLNPLIPAPLGSDLPAQAGLEGSDLAGGDSSTGDVAESQVGTPKVGGVSPLVVPHKKFPILLLFLIPILIIVAVIAIYVLLQVRTMYQQTVAVASPAPSPTPIASADPIADWQTYNNPSALFSFKYPLDLKITIDCIEKKTCNESFINIGDINIQQFKTNSSCENINNSSFSDPVEKSNIKLDNQESLLISSDNFQVEGNEPANFRIICVTLGAKSIKIQYSAPINSIELGRFNQILSTFKFTDQ